jgi:hypothetical protein
MNTSPDHPPFKVRPCQVDLNERNQAQNKYQQISETFDFSREDRVNDSSFNEVIWKAVKGVDSPCPPAVRAAFYFAVEAEDKD